MSLRVIILLIIKILKKHFTITHIHTTHNIEPDEKKETFVHLSRFEL